MPTLNLTVKMLENLKAPADPGARIEYFDDSLPGFTVRVTHDGRKTFTFLYRLQGRRSRIKLGTCPPLSLKEAGITEQRMNANLDTLVALASKDVNMYSSPCECKDEKLRQLFQKVWAGN